MAYHTWRKKNCIVSLGWKSQSMQGGNVRIYINLISLRKGTVTGLCEQGSECLSSIKVR